MELAAYEEGGPNDPKVNFRELREILTLVKDELSPYCWAAYDADYRQRQKAERKLLGLNRLPGSGAEPKDGVVQGTPLWQERLDKMLLVEHLKKKIMSAHSYFVDSAELFLKCHAWLVKNPNLADMFVEHIRRVPPSQHERVDLLQLALAASRKQTEDLREEFEDYQLDLKKKREFYLQRTVEHQSISLRRARKDQSVILWSYKAQHRVAVRLDETRRTLEARTCALEAFFSARTEELDESRRQWDEEREELTLDRDKYKKLYTKMVKAHEQAMEDLKNSEGSVEDQAKMIMVLSTEKSRLTDKVEELEEDKKKMAKQLAEARDQIARLREMMRGMRQSSRETEMLLWQHRQEGEALRAAVAVLERRLDEAAQTEARLRDDLLVARTERGAYRTQSAETASALVAEQRLRGLVAAERDKLLRQTRHLEAQMLRVIPAWKREVEEVKAKAEGDLEHFKSTELAQIIADFKRQTDVILRRNALLEREVAIGDDVSANIAGLNPLAVDASRVCASCRKAFVFEGTKEDKGY